MTEDSPEVDSLFQEHPDHPELLDWSRKRELRKFYIDRAMRSHLFLSAGMGIVAAALPILLIGFGDYCSHFSISHFYHDDGPAARNIFVGSLWAIGLFLILFRGLSSIENHILRLAGVLAIMVAMFPTKAAQGDMQITLHLVSAVLFFVCLAIVAVFYSKSRIDDIIYPPKRRLFKRAYNIAGAAMIGMPALVFAIRLIVGRGGATHWIFWIEASGIWAFAAYWFVKTYEYQLLLGVRWHAALTDNGAETPRWRHRWRQRSAS